MGGFSMAMLNNQRVHSADGIWRFVYRCGPVLSGFCSYTHYHLYIYMDGIPPKMDVRWDATSSPKARGHSNACEDSCNDRDFTNKNWRFSQWFMAKADVLFPLVGWWEKEGYRILFSCQWVNHDAISKDLFAFCDDVTCLKFRDAKRSLQPCKSRFGGCKLRVLGV